MARGDPAIVTFNAGELSPLLRGRIDIDKYPHGAEQLENYICTPQGPLRRRPGTQAVDALKQAGPAALIPFEASSAASFVLEVGDHYMRFWYAPTRSKVLNFGGVWNVTGDTRATQAELVTPWAAADLYNPDGTLLLGFAQSNDVMWITHPRYVTMKLERFLPFTFRISAMGDGVHAPVPFKDVKPTQAITVQASAVSGAVTLTASAPLFTPAMVGEYFYLEQPQADSALPWAVNVVTAASEVRRSDGRNYVGSGGTTGTVKPTHSFGTKSDGVVFWSWADDGYGIVALQGVTDSTHATGFIIASLPKSVTTAPSNRWARQAWNVDDGWPNTVCFFRERLCFARGQTLWGSVTADFENFQATDGGQVTADLALTLTIAARKNDRILWLDAGNALICGTAGGEYTIEEATTQEPFGPLNVRATPRSGYGVMAGQPLRISDSTLYIQRGGRRVRELSYDPSLGTYNNDDRSLLSEHLPEAPPAGSVPHYFVRLAYAQLPDGVIWALSNLGKLYTLTYEHRNEVYGWARQPIGGSGTAFDAGPRVASLCAVLGPDGSNDDVWLIVRRYTGTSETWYLEVIGSAQDIDGIAGAWYYHEIPDVRQANYLDGSEVLTVPASDQRSQTSVQPTVAHATGETLQSLVEGTVGPTVIGLGHGAVVVGFGALTSRKCRVGYPYSSKYWSTKLQGATQTGTPQGKLARVAEAIVRVYRSVGFLIGTSAANKTRVEMRTQHAQMNVAEPLQTGDFRALIDSGYEDAAQIYIEQDQPLPLTVIGVYPKLTVQDQA